jgi:hypothetical protein
MQAAKHAYYDPIRLAELRARVERERGPVDIGYLFNNRRQAEPPIDPGSPGSPDDARAAVCRRTLRWIRPVRLFPENIMLTVEDVPDTTALLVRIDTRRVSRLQVEALVVDMETLLVDAACDPATLTGVTS